MTKYQELMEECWDIDWRTFYEPKEVRCRGFTGHSLCQVFIQLSVSGVANRRAIQSVTEAVEKATRWFRITKADLWVAAGSQVRS